MAARVEIHELTESDLEDVVRFRRREVGADDGPAATRAGVDSSRWYLFDNPESRPDLPKGFVARNESGSIPRRRPTVDAGVPRDWRSRLALLVDDERGQWRHL